MDRSLRISLPDLAATAEFGARLALCLAPGDTVCLTGGLGAGKTALARAVIASACGVAEAPSPTYTIVLTYDRLAGGELWHADLYRIEDESELDELGLEDAFEDAVCLVEWPDRLGARIPKDRLEIELAPETGETGESKNDAMTGAPRIAVLTAFGSWEGRIDGI